MYNWHKCYQPHNRVKKSNSVWGTIGWILIIMVIACMMSTESPSHLDQNDHHKWGQH